MIFLVLLLLLTAPAHAEIRVVEQDDLPVTVAGYRVLDVQDERELACVESVVCEIYHLQSVLPILEEKDWSVYVVLTQQRGLALTSSPGLKPGDSFRRLVPPSGCRSSL